MPTKTALIILSILFTFAIIGGLIFSYLYIWSPQPELTPAWKQRQQQRTADQSLNQEEKIKQMSDTLADMLPAATTSEPILTAAEEKKQEMSETMSKMAPEADTQSTRQEEAERTEKMKTMSDIMKQMVQ